MKVIVCDDEPAQVDLLQGLIHTYSAEKNVDIEILKYSSCDALWWDLEDGLYADLLLLDIQMQPRPDAVKEPLSGIDLARRMRQSRMFHQIAFISGIKDYVFEGYEVDAAAYILKPFTKDQIFRILDKAVSFTATEKAYTLLTSGKDTYKIYHQDVVGLEASLRNTLLYLKQSPTNQIASITLHMGILKCMEFFPSDLLLQIHRSYAVNLKNIARVTKDACIGEDGTVFPIARGQYGTVMQNFIAANKESHV